MQTERPRTIDKETVEEFQHNSWVLNAHTQLILQKLETLASAYQKEAETISDMFDSSTDRLIQLKLKTNRALTVKDIINYVRNNSFPKSETNA